MVDRDITREIWLPIDGHPNYEVSSFGRVRSLTHEVFIPASWYFDAHVRVHKGKILKKSIWLSGSKRYIYQYHRVTLSKDGVNTHRKVHVLVCTAFHGPRPTPEHQVAHWDGNGFNNTEKNLRWATPVENAADTSRHGKHDRGSRHANSKLIEADVMAIRQALAKGVRGRALARKYKVSPATISSINVGKNWSWLP
jgi:hypothetical protein